MKLFFLHGSFFDPNIRSFVCRPPFHCCNFHSMKLFFLVLHSHQDLSFVLNQIVTKIYLCSEANTSRTKLFHKIWTWLYDLVNVYCVTCCTGCCWLDGVYYWWSQENECICWIPFGIICLFFLTRRLCSGSFILPHQRLKKRYSYITDLIIQIQINGIYHFGECE
jgi:hypothetical protein